MGFSCKGLFRGLSSRMPRHLRGGWSPRPWEQVYEVTPNEP